MSNPSSSGLTQKPAIHKNLPQVGFGRNPRLKAGDVFFSEINDAGMRLALEPLENDFHAFTFANDNDGFLRDQAAVEISKKSFPDLPGKEKQNDGSHKSQGHNKAGILIFPVEKCARHNEKRAQNDAFGDCHEFFGGLVKTGGILPSPEAKKQDPERNDCAQTVLIERPFRSAFDGRKYFKKRFAIKPHPVSRPESDMYHDRVI